MLPVVINTDINILGGLPNWDLVNDALQLKWGQENRSTFRATTH